MPNRILREGIITSESVERLLRIGSWPAGFFYYRLLNVVDDFGRYDGRPSVLRAALYPLQLDRVSEPDIARWLAQAGEAGLLRVYRVDGRDYIEVTKFGAPRAKSSKWPPPNGPCAHMRADANTCAHMRPYSDSSSDSDSSSERTPQSPPSGGAALAGDPVDDWAETGFGPPAPRRGTRGEGRPPPDAAGIAAMANVADLTPVDGVRAALTRWGEWQWDAGKRWALANANAVVVEAMRHGWSGEKLARCIDGSIGHGWRTIRDPDTGANGQAAADPAKEREAERAANYAAFAEAEAKLKGKRR